MHQSLIVIDDFYPDLAKVRAMALGAPYEAPREEAGLPGRFAKAVLWTPEHEHFIGQLTGAPVKPVPTAPNGLFRLSPASDATRYKITLLPDAAIAWAGVIFLNNEVECRDGDRSREGLALWRHKASGLEAAPTDEQEAKRIGLHGEEDLVTFMGSVATEERHWEKLISIPMRANRLVLFRPWAWHSHGEIFGDAADPARARLSQLLFLSVSAPSPSRFN